MSHLQLARPEARSGSRASMVLPDVLCTAVLRGLDQVATSLIALGISANAVTAGCIALGAAAGVLLAFGQFGFAATLMVVASLGDAIDGMVARRSGSTSVAGALLDASGDRYQEFFFLGGLAVFFRQSPVALVMTLGALVGSFMVSYSSAKAEGLGVPVPPGVMRRAERAVCLCLATAVTAIWHPSLRGVDLSGVGDALPILIAVFLIAVVANISAVRRLRLVARAATPVGPVRAEPARTDSGRADSGTEGPRELARESSA